MNAAERDRVIAEVFYNKREGFGSLQATYASARRVDPRITKQDVRRFLMNQEVRQRRKPIKVNSYVPDLPREQFQVDLMDMGVRAVPRYGCGHGHLHKEGVCKANFYEGSGAHRC
jgi:hypothetical protein